MELDEDPDGLSGVAVERDPLSPSTTNVNSSRGRSKSKVWNQFVISAEGRKVICRQCGDSLSYSNSHSTSSMLKHLKRKHHMDMYPSNDDDVKTTTGGSKNVGKKNTKVKKVPTTGYPLITEDCKIKKGDEEPSIQHGPLVFKGQYCVRMKWTDHTDTFLGTFSRLYSEESYTDVTLVAEKVFFKAHRVILSSASEFFDETFKATPAGQHPIIFLKDIKALELRILLDFIYKGEISIPPGLIQDLVVIGTQLKVRGLCDFQFNDDMKSAVSSMNQCNEQSDNSTQVQSNNQQIPVHVQHSQPSSSSSSHNSFDSTIAPSLTTYTPLYNSLTSTPTVHTIPNPPVASAVSSKLINLVRTRQIPVTNSTAGSRTLNSLQKTWRSDNCQSPPSHMRAPVSTVESTNNLSNGPALKRFRILNSPSATSNKGGTCRFDISGGTSSIDSQMGQSAAGTVLMNECGTVLEEGINIIPSDSISIKTEDNEIPTSQHLEMHPITLVSHHIGNTTEEDLDEVVYSITGPHGEVLMSDTGEIETNERETIVVYGTGEDVRLSNSCESVKKTL